MRWVTRDRIKVDRVACPWLISRFIDAEADFAFVPALEVDAFAQTTGAVPFDVAGADIGHHGDRCSFDALLDKYEMDDPALRRLALIVRGADTDARQLCPEAAGLHAVAVGFNALSPSVYRDDHALLRVEFPIYDALYEWCKREVGEHLR
jgi:hypothetical protein